MTVKQRSGSYCCFENVDVSFWESLPVDVFSCLWIRTCCSYQRGECWYQFALSASSWQTLIRVLSWKLIDETLHCLVWSQSYTDPTCPYLTIWEWVSLINIFLHNHMFHAPLDLHSKVCFCCTLLPFAFIDKVTYSPQTSVTFLCFHQGWQ